jgi:hypothetical protein
MHVKVKLITAPRLKVTLQVTIYLFEHVCMYHVQFSILFDLPGYMY